MKNVLVAQSGGPTAAINATLAGVLQGAREGKEVSRVYGARNGIEGAIKGNVIDLTEILTDETALEELTHTPSSALGTCRYKMKDWTVNEEPYLKILETFKKYEIKYFVYIGGNDSMDTVNQLSAYCKLKDYDVMVMGAPKTVDNDLNLTDHCPGFGSAAKYIATTISELACDIGAYDIPAVTIVEIMGRNAGWLTAAAALPRLNDTPGADLIYLCEKPFEIATFLMDVREQLAKKSGILVAVSEGIHDGEGVYISEHTSSGAVDNFGHKYIAGAAIALEHVIRKEIGCKVRSIELNLMQRSAAHIASQTDLSESIMLGKTAITSALNGETGRMAAVNRVSNSPYRVEYVTVPVSEVANAEKKVPENWITADGHDVTDEMMDYLKPLIQGETAIKYKNGIPVIKKLY